MRITALGALATSTVMGAVLIGAAAHAQLNQLEIKEPRVEAGEIELEFLGDHNSGQPRRRFLEEAPSSFVFDANDFNRLRTTAGIGYGLTKWFGLQLQIEAEQARFEDAETIAASRAFGELKVTEIQLEGTVVLVPVRKDGYGAALLFEHNIALDRREADQLFLGTALQFVQGPWSATANLYAVKNLGGREELHGTRISDERWDFQYAAQIKYRANAALALGLEAYGVVERLGGSGTKSEERELFGDFDRHLLGPVAYYSWGADDGRGAKKARKGLRARAADAEDKNGDHDKNGDKDGARYTLGVGVLFGLNANTSGTVVKWALGVEF